MAHILAILASLLLLTGFLALVRYETGHKVRFLAGPRSFLDNRVERATYVARTVNWSAFTRHLVRSGVARIAHDIATATLIVVRVIERVLTRVVKYLRTRRSAIARTSEETSIDMQESLTEMRSAIGKDSA